jgi:tRNA-specific adenosine deaminase 2
MKTTEEFMKEAIKLGQEALDAGEVPVGCIFVLDGKIVASARNRTNETLNATSHAEMVAMKAMDSLVNVKNMDLYVTIEPCIMCASALRQVGLRHCYFGAGNDKFGGCGTVLSLHSDENQFPPYAVTPGILAGETINLLRRFYVKENDSAPEPKKKKTRTLKLI